MADVTLVHPGLSGVEVETTEAGAVIRERSGWIRKTAAEDVTEAPPEDDPTTETE